VQALWPGLLLAGHKRGTEEGAAGELAEVVVQEQAAEHGKEAVERGPAVAEGVAAVAAGGGDGGRAAAAAEALRAVADIKAGEEGAAGEAGRATPAGMEEQVCPRTQILSGQMTMEEGGGLGGAVCHLLPSKASGVEGLGSRAAGAACHAAWQMCDEPPSDDDQRREGLHQGGAAP
jgi:hypothetical protein